MKSVFGLGLRVREKLYEAGVFKTRHLKHPVISVGNLTLGGTGKTPLTMFLAERMKARGFRPVILSRGYRRSSRGPLIVSRGGGPLVPWTESGDEPSLMAQRLRGMAAVVVGESRHEAGLLAERENLGDLFLLDDGFQHRALHRNVDIVSIDPEEWHAGESLLPTGRWREPRNALNRAHAACVQSTSNSAKLDLAIPTFQVELKVEGFRSDGLADRSVTAFAGIAKPERFFRTLESLGIRIDQRVPFPDHHHYQAADVAKLGGDVRITTEKDAVRLVGLGDFVVLRVSATIQNFERLQQLILDRLT